VRVGGTTLARVRVEEMSPLKIKWNYVHRHTTTTKGEFRRPTFECTPHFTARSSCADRELAKKVQLSRIGSRPLAVQRAID